MWGSGRPRRAFLHVDDLAEACIFTMTMAEDAWWSAVPERCSHVNVGTGLDLSISQLASMIRDVVGYEGALVYDPSKPDGTPRKLLDVSRMTALGWKARISLEQGLADRQPDHRGDEADPLGDGRHCGDRDPRVETRQVERPEARAKRTRETRR